MNQPRVVILGGGFAGLECAIELAAHKDIHVTLLDRNNYQQFQPLLYQVATSILSPSNAAFALRDILRDHPNVDVQMDEAVSIDLTRRSVTTASGQTHSGDFLVLATGSRVNFYDTPGAEEHSLPLYTLRDAEALRSTILKALEQADLNPEKQTGGKLNFVVVGGGPTGVELAGTLSDTLQQLLQDEFHHAAQLRPQIHLVERGPAVLAMFSPASQKYAASALEKHGVQLHLGVSVNAVSSDGVSLSDDSQIDARTVVWAAGLKAATATLQPEPQRLPNGRFVVDKDLAVPGFENVYALGDIANALDSGEKPLPQLAAVAKQAGKHCAVNILATLDRKPTTPFVYSDRGIVAMIGRNAAVTELGSEHFELVGTFAFAAWLAIHALLLTVARARMEAIIEWAWQYFTGEHSSQLIDR
jgi:NADH:ubiquinone reductase (H+-translocating)